eukprot:506183-Amphidinium_carterae.1
MRCAWPPWEASHWAARRRNKSCLSLGRKATLANGSGHPGASLTLLKTCPRTDWRTPWTLRGKK